MMCYLTETEGLMTFWFLTLIPRQHASFRCTTLLITFMSLALDLRECLELHVDRAENARVSQPKSI